MLRRKYYSIVILLITFSTVILPLSNIGKAYSIRNNNDNSLNSCSPSPLDSSTLLPATENYTIPDRPLLAVKKTINITENIEPFQWIEVKLNITNIGNRTAYNLSITDPDYEDWAISTFNFTQQRYVEVETNTSFIYQYYIQPRREGNFTLEATVINYVDINGTKYTAYSQRFDIISLYPQHEEVIDKVKWLNLFYYVLAIVGTLLVIELIDLFAIQKVHKKWKTKGTKKPAISLKKTKSKKEQRKKIQKRKRR